MILRHWKKIFFTFIMPTFYGGGGGGPTQTTSTVTQSSVPDWLRPQTEALLGAAQQQVFNNNPTTGAIESVRGFTPYSANPADYFAPFSPMQQQSFNAAGNLQVPGQYNVASDMTANAGIGALNSANQALGYGGAASNLAGRALGYQGAGTGIGNIGLGYGAQAAGYGQQAANLAGAAQGYGAQGFGAGQTGQNLGLSAADIYGGQATNIGSQATGLAGQGLGYGQQAANIGRLASAGAAGLGGNVANQAMGYGAQAAGAGQEYANMATDPSSIQAYMSPYQQAVTDVAKQGALRDFQVGQTMRQANAAKAGAYGGSRQAIENAEAQRNLNTQLQGIEAQGLQSAFDKAQQAQQFQIQQKLAGLQGANTSLNTALGGGQLGLSGAGQAIQGQQAALQGVGQANQAYQTGLQGTQTGLQAAGVGLQGTAQGMQGAQVGLAGLTQAGNLYGQGMQGAQAAQQGVQNALSGQQLGLSGLNAANQAYQTGLKGVQGAQAGYGLGTQAGTALGNLGTADLAARQGIIGLQNQYGQQQTQYQQDIINQAIQNYANAQQYPMQQLAFYNSLLRGFNTPTSASTQYQTAPSAMSQVGGLAATALGAYGALKKEGGAIKEKTYKAGGLVDLAIANALEGDFKRVD
jgi:hypothetical protein